MKNRIPPVFTYLERALCPIQAVFAFSILCFRVGAPWGLPYRASFSYRFCLAFLVNGETEIGLIRQCGLSLRLCVCVAGDDDFYYSCCKRVTEYERETSIVPVYVVVI